jgi:hypothetical protein
MGCGSEGPIVLYLRAAVSIDSYGLATCAVVFDARVNSANSRHRSSEIGCALRFRRVVRHPDWATKWVGYAKSSVGC